MRVAVDRFLLRYVKRVAILSINFRQRLDEIAGVRFIPTQAGSDRVCVKPDMQPQLASSVSTDYTDSIINLCNLWTSFAQHPVLRIGFIVNTIRHPAKERIGPLMKRTFAALTLLIVLALASSLPSLRAAAPAALFFDDFTYLNKQQLKNHGWIIRTEPGWPGVPGAIWREDGVTLVEDPDQPRNK